MMDQNPQIEDLWSRLPVFRVVAATEHLPTAAKILHITPPAISRTIKLLEEELGQPLFRRTGRQLVLNAAGRRLQASLTDAVESLETSLKNLSADPLAGPVRIATIGVLTDYVALPALLSLKETHSLLEPNLLLRSPQDAHDGLVRGLLDVAFYYEALTDERLEINHLGELRAGIYCGKNHPLFKKRKLTQAQILEHPFSVPQTGQNGLVQDGWPVELNRRIGMRITMLSSNLAVCLSGQFLTVLPDVVADRYIQSKELKQLPMDVIEPIPVYGARRKSDGENTASALVLRCITSKLKSLTR
ncbi:MAG: LysR family transcriptional regulator [Deltaproteobacteria bacterium]|jgi:DNA-binding transcriptional LysR family regulator|nr:LysR family transcriptional regulator [Deltaproteobacteria bacterium]